MSTPIHTGMPCEFTAGDDVVFLESDSRYPVDTYSLKLILALAGVKKAEIEADAVEGKWKVTIPAETTEAFSAGVYDIAEFITSTEFGRQTYKRGQARILPNLAVNQTPTTAQAMLTACETACIKLARGTNENVDFSGQIFKKKDLGKLLEARDRLRTEVMREQDALAGVSSSGWKTIHSRFPR